MRYRRMPIEIESPEALGYERIRHNLAESSVSDVRLRDLSVALDDLVLQYGDHLGHAGLRELVAADGPGLRADDVMLTPGAAGALFIIATCLLGPGDHLVVSRPNYATNLETPRAIGTIVGPGHWFEQDDRSFRLGFGWPTHEELEGGLAALSETAARLS